MTEMILFVVTTIISYVVLFLIPRSNSKENGVTSLIINLMLQIGIWVFVTGILNLCHIKINLYTIAVINIVVFLAAFIYMYINKWKIQSYYVQVLDLVVLLILAATAVTIGLYRFENDLSVFAYESDDSVRHFSYVKGLMNTGNFTNGRYVMHLISMIFIKCALPFIGEMFSYKAFAAADIFLFFMLGAMFWTWIRPMMSGKYEKASGVGFTLMYFWGYPLNNMLFGFEYLGAGILAVNFLLWILWENDAREMSKWQLVVLLMLANTMIFLSYTQFAPAVLIGELIYFLIKFGGVKKIFTWLFWSIIVVAMGVPGLLCMAYVAPQYFAKVIPLVLSAGMVILMLCGVTVLVLQVQAKKNHSTIKKMFRRKLEWFAAHKKLLWAVFGIIIFVVMIIAYKVIYQGLIVGFAANQIMTTDGNIYREPYANFLILMFPVILYILDSIKKKRNDAVLWMLLGTMLFSMWLLISVLTGRVTTYYFYKMHYLIWLLLYGTAFRWLVSTKADTRHMMTVYLGAVSVFFLIAMSGLEKKLEDVNEWLWTDGVSPKVFGIYNNNLELLKKGGNVDEEIQTILNVVYGLVDEENTFVPYFGEDARYRKQYYYYLTGQDPNAHPFWLNNPDAPAEDILSELKKLNVEYIFVTNEYEEDGIYFEIFEELDVMFETDYGRIIALR